MNTCEKCGYAHPVAMSCVPMMKKAIEPERERDLINQQSLQQAQTTYGAFVPTTSGFVGIHVDDDTFLKNVERQQTNMTAQQAQGAPIHRFQPLMDERAALRIYLQVKMNAEDWHAVADAACDLREIDAKLSVLK